MIPGWRRRTTTAPTIPPDRWEIVPPGEADMIFGDRGQTLMMIATAVDVDRVPEGLELWVVPYDGGFVRRLDSVVNCSTHPSPTALIDMAFEEPGRQEGQRRDLTNIVACLIEPGEGVVWAFRHADVACSTRSCHPTMLATADPEWHKPQPATAWGQTGVLRLP